MFKAASLSLLMALAAGCTVKPLHSDGPGITIGGGAGGQAGTMAQDLSSIAIAEPETRVGQEVRNHLIFAFGRGAGEPANPRYSLALTVLPMDRPIMTAPVRRLEGGGTEERPTASQLRLKGIYVLTEIATGKEVVSGTHEILSSYDRPKQEFASARAKLDAEDRAARELAEFIRLSISMAKRPAA